MSDMDDEWIFPNQTAIEVRWEEEQLRTIAEANHQKFEKEYQSNFTSQPVDPRTRYEEEIYKLRTRLHELESEKNIRLKTQLAEVSLRIKYPAVQEAWEQLEIVKKLVQK